MKRRLNESRIGEYKGSLLLNIIYTVINIIAIVGLFIAPISYQGESSFSSLVKLSPVNYLIDHGTGDVLGCFSLSLVILFGIVFVSSYLCFSIPKMGKSVYIKVIKVIEIMLTLVCLIGLSMALYNFNASYVKEYLIIYYCWQGLLILMIILALLNYFKIKKISIYD